MIQLFLKGGPLMWPMLLVSLVTFTVIFERVVVLYREKRRRQPEALRKMSKEIAKGNILGAAVTGEVSSDFVARCLSYALRHTESSFASAYQQQAARELRRFSRGTLLLDTVITLAPLMGLLGTVTGMIHAFGLMGANELEAPAAITGGIAEALIATAFGLGIAICALIPFNWLNSRVEEAQHELQDAGTQAELILAQAAQNTHSASKHARSENVTPALARS
jgi:biopolymer transport protein ExbB